jgi:hypothetical protein
MQPLEIPLAPTIYLSGESVASIINSCGRYQAPRRKVDGTFWMYLNPIFNGVVTQIEIKGYCIRLVNSCNIVLIFGNR